MNKTIKVERRGDSGFEEQELSIENAVSLLNNDISNEMTVWIDSRPFMGSVIQASDLETCRKGISVTNRLVGG